MRTLLDRLVVKRDPAVEVVRDFGAYSVLFDGRPLRSAKACKPRRGTLTRRC
jgi:hypothetical protein